MFLLFIQTPVFANPRPLATTWKFCMDVQLQNPTSAFPFRKIVRHSPKQCCHSPTSTPPPTPKGRKAEDYVDLRALQCAVVPLDAALARVMDYRSVGQLIRESLPRYGLWKIVLAQASKIKHYGYTYLQQQLFSSTYTQGNFCLLFREREIIIIK